MDKNNTYYSHTQGLKLLESAILENGPIFTIDKIKPIAKTQGLSDTNLRFLINSLASSGWIEIIKRGTYVVKSPIYNYEIPPFAIAAALVKPMAISHWSACALHGFTNQIPSIVQASTPRKVVTPEMRSGHANSPRGRAIWKTCDIEFEFINVRQDAFWGFNQEWVNSWQQVNITDLDRTGLDLIARPDIFGGISASIEVLENALGQLNIDRLVNYAIKYNTGSIIKRLGWALEKLGVPLESLVPLHNFPVRRYFLLDLGSNADAPRNARWHIIENL